MRRKIRKLIWDDKQTYWQTDDKRIVPFSKVGREPKYIGNNILVNARMTHENSAIKTKLVVWLFTAARVIFQLSGGCHHYRWQGCILSTCMLFLMGFSSESSFTCHTCCNMGPRFIRSNPKDRYQRTTVRFEQAT
jgi:hypothetical protein